MRGRHRSILIIAAGVCGVVVLLALSALYFLQSNWFKEKIREKIISAIEGASGGQVELKSFNYDWRTLSAEFSNLTIHGNEPNPGPPLFRADSVRVGLSIVSLLKRQVDIAALKVERPEIYLLVRADGSANVPAPRNRRMDEIVEELLNLKVRHFDLHRGVIRADEKQIPLSARGDNLKLLLNYDFSGPRYDFSVYAQQLHIDSDQIPAASADLEAHGGIEKDRIVVQQIVLKSGASSLEASGTLAHFTHPNADFRLNLQTPSREFAAIVKLPELRSGNLALDATAHYERSTGFIVNGKTAGHDLAYQSRLIAFTGGEFESNVAGSAQDLRFTGLSFSALGSRVVGEATLRHFRELRLNGKVSGLNLRDLGRLYTRKALPWSGVASGPVQLAGTLDRRARNFVVHTELQIAPRSAGIPVSGDVAVSYSEKGNLLEIAHSHFAFPSTRLSIAGTVGATLQISLDSANLQDLMPALFLAGRESEVAGLPFALEKGSLHFDGTVVGQLLNPHIQGNVALDRFRVHGQLWDKLRSGISLSASELDFSSLAVDQGTLHATANGRIGLADWSVKENSPFHIEGQFKGEDLNAVSEFRKMRLPVSRGIASGSLDIRGALNAPSGSARVAVDDLDAYGERVTRIQIATTLAGDSLQITNGRVQAGPAIMSFSGTYEHVHDSWREGQARVRIDSNGFPMAGFSTVRKYEPGVTGDFEIHAQAAAHITPDHIEPIRGDGRIVLRNIAVQGVKYGDVLISAATHGRTLDANFSGDLRTTQLNGTAQVQLISGTPVKGELRLGRMGIATLSALVNSGRANPLPIRGFLQGGVTFEGPLQRPDEVRSTIRIEQVQLSPTIAAEGTGQTKPSDLLFRNQGPIVLEASNGNAVIRSFQMVGQDTSLTLSGSIPYAGERHLNVRADGSLDLRAFELFDANVQCSGQSRIAAVIQGTRKNPAVTGTLEVKNGSFFLNDLPNGLSAVNGTVRFDSDRATIQKATARSGGGDLSLRGFVSFAGGGPLVYHLDANAENVRLRYAPGISVTASSGLRLAGTSKSSLLSGAIRVSRVAFNPSADIGSLLTRGAAPVPAATNQSDFIAGIQLDVRIESAPDLQVNTTLSQDVEAEISLRVHGTPDRPIVLGSISANQGDIKIFGTKYSINRGQVNFVNPVKIEPMLDLDLQTQARGITVDITISGTLSKLNINYRSDPPLQPKDIVALLTVGRTPDIASNMANVQARNEPSTLQSGANTVLGQAISPASNRLSKLFGITNIKIDPFVQGIITNTPQARLTVEQQMSRDITITYVTNLSQTSEQIFRLEWALSRQYSVIALRDDNGEFGIDIQYKKRFK
jgi:translocation and assembly module TamB